jgi:plastocyanin
MNSLDSRHLRVGDTFALRFTTPGAFHYGVGVAGGPIARGHHAAFEIVVRPDAGPSHKTHYVKVTYENGALGVDTPKLEVNRDDAVMWSAAAGNAPGFRVSGHGEGGEFDSSELPVNSLYTHVFGSPGEVKWGSPHHPDLHGTIIVETHPVCRNNQEREAYFSKLAEPTLVLIDNHRARPGQATITVGQTVFFAVRTGGGISIVDKTLLAAANPQPQSSSPPSQD